MPERQWSPPSSPSLGSPYRATIAHLSEEAIDLVCAFVRDDKDAEVATRTLCALARTARMFYSSAQRGLLYDPTRALLATSKKRPWCRMGEFLHRLLSDPALGRHVRRLDTLPDFWATLVDEVYEHDYTNWLLALDLLCPSLLSISVSAPVFGNSESAALRALASKPQVKSLLFHLDFFEVWEADDRLLHTCQDFLAALDLSRLECLQLPPIDAEYAALPDRPPMVLPCKHLIVQDVVDARDPVPAFITRYFDLRNVRTVVYRFRFLDGLDLGVLQGLPVEVESLTIQRERQHHASYSWWWKHFRYSAISFPSLTQLTLHGFALVREDLEDTVHRFPLLRRLDFSGSVWSGPTHYASTWLGAIHKLSHLHQLRTGILQCETTSACARLHAAITEFCDRNGIDVICTPELTPDSTDCACSEESASEPGSDLLDPTGIYACCGDSLVNGDDTNELWSQQPRAEDGDDFFLANEWLRSVSAADQHIHHYERFARDGVPWHWDFDAFGWPVAVPDDIACVPAVAFAHEEVDSDGEDAASLDSNASSEYFSPLPDVARLEDDYEAYDDDDQVGGGGGNVDASADDEPWLTWSEPCDFDEADEAWVRFDIDDQGKELGSASAAAGAKAVGTEDEDEEIR
ncbi:hypothetical protein JCM3774_006192 [Rhodotorula dairenensis]